LRRNLRSLVFIAMLFFVSVILAQYFSNQFEAAKAIDYTTFLNRVQAGEVARVKIVEQSIQGTLKDGTEFTTFIPRDDAAMLPLLRERGVVIEAAPPPQPPLWTALLSTVLPVLLVVGAFFFIMQQTQGGGSRVLQFGRSRAKLHTDQKRRVTFADVAGADEVKEELSEIVDFLKNARRYTDLGARIPKGVLLMGAPGTGKTWVARAVAGEAGVPFYTISGSDFVEMFVGVGASRVRDLFAEAKKNAPCIVFIDEIDAVGRQRGAGYGGGHDEREQTLNQLLVEMDGFGPNEGVIVIAATNRPDVLDPALLRPGRFDRQIVIDKPDLKGRLEILKVHARGKPLEEKTELEVIARRTPGFTPADLENVVNESALLAARVRKKRISLHELEEAIDRVIAGPERKSKLINEREKRIVAVHEAAHALVGRLLPGADPVHKVSIIPRGAALGYTLQLPLEDRYLVTRDELFDRIVVTLAGRAAEEMVLDVVSTGAHDDLDKASKLIRKMITEFGMSSELGPLTFGSSNESPFLGRDMSRERNYSEEVGATIDREVRELAGKAYEHARQLLRDNMSSLDRLTDALLEHETLEGDELEAVFGQLAANNNSSSG
jgi:cell division protease FtsH